MSLTQISESYTKYPRGTSTQKRKYAVYRCDCGNEKEAQCYDVKSGASNSCGCTHGKPHGLANHPLYDTWRAMMSRCNNVNDRAYDNYGGRGIKTCDRWEDVSYFIEDMLPTHEKGLTIDRIDVNGNYELGNCRWATKTVQQRNTRVIRSSNTSGYRGVCFDKANSKFKASIGISNKLIHLGRYQTALEAAIAYDTYVLTNKLEHTRNMVLPQDTQE